MDIQLDLIKDERLTSGLVITQTKLKEIDYFFPC